MRLITSLTLPLLGSALLASQAQASQPGSVELSLELSPVQNIVEQSAWTSEVDSTAAIQGAPVDKDEGTLSVGFGIGYMLDKVGELRYGIQYGYRNLGGEKYTSTNTGGSATLDDSGNYHRLNFVGQLPLGESGLYLVGRAGLAAAHTKNSYHYQPTVGPTVNVDETASKTSPYFAGGIGLGGDMAQFQLLFESVKLPDSKSTPLASGKRLDSEDSLSIVTLGASFFF